MKYKGSISAGGWVVNCDEGLGQWQRGVHNCVRVT